MRKTDPFTISLRPSDREKLEDIAKSLNCFWGNSPSISILLRKIADGDLIIVETDSDREDSKNYEDLKLKTIRFHAQEILKNLGEGDSSL